MQRTLLKGGLTHFHLFHIVSFLRDFFRDGRIREGGRGLKFQFDGLLQEIFEKVLFHENLGGNSNLMALDRSR